MDIHDRLLSGRLNARFTPGARDRAAVGLLAAKRQVLQAAMDEAAETPLGEGDSTIELALEEALDAYRLLSALIEELRS